MKISYNKLSIRLIPYQKRNLYEYRKEGIDC